jgi:hypothetical protein
VRRALRAAEARGFEPEPDRLAPSRAETGRDESWEGIETLRRRIEMLERRLEDGTPTGGPADMPVLSPEGRVRERLRAEGCEPTSVVVHRERADAFEVEARRQGAVLKGTAVLSPDGRVTLSLAPAWRVFP